MNPLNPRVVSDRQPNLMAMKMWGKSYPGLDFNDPDRVIHEIRNAEPEMKKVLKKALSDIYGINDIPDGFVGDEEVIFYRK